MSFQIKENSLVNIYATIPNELANNFLTNKERLIIGNENEGYTVIKLLEGIKVLGVFTIDGVDINDADGDNVDSILISVTPDEAKEINLLRDIATFNITGINISKEILNISGDAINNNFVINNSGDLSGEGI